MKNILLLTDFSSNSIDAINYALKLFSGNQCNFFVLHVELSNTYISDDLMATGNQSIYSALVKKPKTELNHLVEELKNQTNEEDYHFEMIMDYDVFIDAIKQVIEKKHIDLIVMGTNGVTGAKEIVFGSNTINVIRKVNCSTLVVPEGVKYKSPKQILLPLDLFDAIDSEAFTEVLKFTHRFGKKLHLVRIKPNNEDSIEEKKDSENIANLLNNTDYEYRVIDNVPMQHAVTSYTQIHKIDIIHLLVQKESFFERVFTGSSTTDISNKLKVPLLVFHS